MSRGKNSLSLNKREYAIIGALIGLSIPFFGFVLFWWSAASLKILRIANISDSAIGMTAVVGLCTGILINILFMKKLMPRFYILNTALCVLIYLFCSLMAVAFFMGIPIGNLVLGMLAGVYIGRKNKHLDKNDSQMRSASKRVGVFTAMVTGVEALAIGVLAIREESIIHRLDQLTSLHVFHFHGIVGVFLIVLLSALLYLIQYVLSKKAAKRSFGL